MILLCRAKGLFRVKCVLLLKFIAGRRPPLHIGSPLILILKGLGIRIRIRIPHILVFSVLRVRRRSDLWQLCGPLRCQQQGNSLTTLKIMLSCRVQGKNEPGKCQAVTNKPFGL